MDKKQKLENLIFDIFDKEIEGADVYHYDGTEWLIFTEEKKWVTEFTETKTLWYNYKHFNDLLVYFGMGASKSTEYIKKWYEERFIFKPKVENTIQNGVKHTQIGIPPNFSQVENTIQNGVKQPELSKRDFFPEDILQNGVKSTFLMAFPRGALVENTIQNGVKYTQPNIHSTLSIVENTIQNGVKHTEAIKHKINNAVEHTIQNGVKHTYSFDINYRPVLTRVEDTIQNGVKHTKKVFHCPTDQVEHTIQNGVKDIINIV